MERTLSYRTVEADHLVYHVEVQSENCLQRYVYVRDKLKLSTQSLQKQESESEKEDEVKTGQPNVISDYESDTSGENEERDDHVVQQHGPRNNDRYNLRACPQPPTRYQEVLSHILSVV